MLGRDEETLHTIMIGHCGFCSLYGELFSVKNFGIQTRIYTETDSRMLYKRSYATNITINTFSFFCFPKQQAEIKQNKNLKERRSENRRHFVTFKHYTLKHVCGVRALNMKK